MSELFAVQNLYKHYGDATVVNDVSFAIAPGECLGVIGPNGAGKTTTIRMCLGLTAPDSGDVLFYPEGSTQPLYMPRDALAIKAQLGVVTQFDTLDPDFTCAENLRVFGRYFGLKGRTMDERVPQLLEFAALTHKADAKPGELSGGMKRRLSLARALVNRPRLLLLQQGTSILLTTHFMDEAERLCSRLLVLDHGKKIAEGKPRELIVQHLESDVVEVFGVGAVALAEDANLRALAARVEISGETVFFYTQNAQPLLQALGQHGHLRTLHRPANLEDLFLKLTGRQIRE